MGTTPQAVNQKIKDAAVQAARETDGEPEPAYTGNFTFPANISIGQGLEGAIACTTNVGYVNGAKGWLVYRGFNCLDLAEKSTFEETTYLLLFGKLPNKKELADFDKKLKSQRKLNPAVFKVLKSIPIKDTHPMTVLEIAVAVLGAFDKDADDTSIDKETKIAIFLISQLATIAAAVARLRQGKDPVDPDLSLSHAGNFLYMMTGKKPTPVEERIMDVSLILHADHGMNASTFTSMVTNSSLSDMYSSIVAGIASLKGPLHGGANEKVLYQLEEIGKPENVEKWFDNTQKNKVKVMGFGHRVYKAYDPRARVLKPLADMVTQNGAKNLRGLYDIAVKLDGIVSEKLSKEKKIFPNVDFYSGVVYKAMGIEPKMFTPIFAVSRVSGWAARVLEYLANNRLFRPRAVYTGPMKVEYTPLDKR